MRKAVKCQWLSLLFVVLAPVTFAAVFITPSDIGDFQ